MLTLIDDIKEIETLLSELKEKLAKVSGSSYPVNYKSQNNKSIPIDISLNNAGFWWGQTKVTEENKLLNPFGLGEPTANSDVLGDFEFSFSTIMQTKKFSGQFGKKKSNRYLLHNGRFSGKSLADFDRHCLTNKIFRSEVGKKNDVGYYVIANLRDANLSKSIRQFIDNVVKFKDSN